MMHSCALSWTTFRFCFYYSMVILQVVAQILTAQLTVTKYKHRDFCALTNMLNWTFPRVNNETVGL